MVNLTTYELRLITEKRGIKNYKNMSRERLLPTLDKLEHNFKNMSQNGLEQIAKMRNLPQNELEQIAKMRDIYFVKVNQITQKKKRLKKFLIK